MQKKGVLISVNCHHFCGKFVPKKSMRINLPEKWWQGPLSDSNNETDHLTISIDFTLIYKIEKTKL